MKKPLLFMVLTFALTGAAAHGFAQFINDPGEVEARLIKHQDGTYTDVIKDPLKQQMTETTYDRRKIVISTKKYLLNSNGDPTQGQIFDGAGNLIARVQFSFDDLQRITEERCLNLQGEMFRKVLHLYDSSGRPLPVKAMDYKVHAPNMRVASIDFTHTKDLPKQAAAPAVPNQPGQAPQIQSVSPTTGDTFNMTAEQQAAIAQQQAAMAKQAQQMQAAEDKKKKKGFLGLFK